MSEFPKFDEPVDLGYIPELATIEGLNGINVPAPLDIEEIDSQILGVDEIINVPELEDLEEHSAKTRVYEEQVRADNFASPEAKTEALCNYRNYWRQEEKIAANPILHEQALKLGELCLAKIVERAPEKELLRALEPVQETKEEDVAYDIGLKQVVNFYKRYRADTDDEKGFKNALYVMSGVRAEEDTSWREILKTEIVTLRFERYHVAISDGNYMRYSQDLTRTDSNFVSILSRSLIAVAESEHGLTSTQVWEAVFGKEVPYDAKIMKPIRKWMLKATHNDQNIVVTSGKHGAKTKFDIAPNFEVEIIEAPEQKRSEEESSSEDLKTHQEAFCVLAHYFQGPFEKVLKDYKYKPITADMLEALDDYAPDNLSQSGIARHRELAFNNLLEIMEDPDKLSELVHNFIDANLPGDKGGDTILSIFEKVKGREFLKAIMHATWGGDTVLHRGQTGTRGLILTDSHGREIWPNKPASLVS